ncbi:hypothetical protein FALCPG4_016768 [Fusarium falciforme]
MELHSNGVDHDFELELMLRFPRDMSKPERFSANLSTTWPSFVLPQGLEDWEHDSDDEIADRVLADANSLELQPRSLYFRVLRTWLLNCDENHEECRWRQSGRGFWPTRAVYLGDHLNLRIVEEPHDEKDYVILSHCWGKPREDEWKHFCTTPQNYHHRLDGFCFGDLPKTFQHAIEVTRELRKEYVWIDALCIIQGPDGDWQSEAGRIEHVFANGYCAVAANSVEGWKDGFLESGLWDQINPESVDCECLFDSEVGEAYLMQRAWVLQERVLSRRIIHFTSGVSNPRPGHAYWECRGGIRCQQPSKLSPPINKDTFIHDPYFPARLKDAS